jgi:hypothetical protein
MLASASPARLSASSLSAGSPPAQPPPTGLSVIADRIAELTRDVQQIHRAVANSSDLVSNLHASIAGHPYAAGIFHTKAQASAPPDHPGWLGQMHANLDELRTSIMELQGAVQLSHDAVTAVSTSLLGIPDPRV